MRVIVVLKYIPTRGEDRKSDMLWSVVDGLCATGYDVALATGPFADRVVRQENAWHLGVD